MAIFGTRPEVIKMAPVVHALQAVPDIKCLVCTTSQHRHMQDQMVELFGLKVDYDLDVMKVDQDLFYLTSEVLLRLQKVFQAEKPDLILVHGDTTTSFVASLRTYQLQAPFPEEANRQLTSRLATLHFAPTALAEQNLLNEGVAKDRIIVTGNTVIDALFWIKNRINKEKIARLLPEAILNLIAQKSPYVLITGHRRENFGEGFLAICEAIKTLAQRHREWHFIYPVHLNPRVREPVYKLLAQEHNIHLIEPIDYEPFTYLMDHSQMVLTDSGGVQEEAPSLGKPVLVMREVTERPEGVAAGTAKLVGTDPYKIVDNVQQLMHDKALYQAMANAVNPYGDGNAALRIVNHIQQYFG